MIDGEKNYILLVEDSSDDEALTLRSLRSNRVTNEVTVVRDVPGGVAGDEDRLASGAQHEAADVEREIAARIEVVSEVALPGCPLRLVDIGVHEAAAARDRQILIWTGFRLPGATISKENRKPEGPLKKG